MNTFGHSDRDFMTEQISPDKERLVLTCDVMFMLHFLANIMNFFFELELDNVFQYKFIKDHQT